MTTEETSMSSVIDFAPPPPPVSPNLRRIRLLSGGLEQLFRMAGLLTAVLVALEIMLPWTHWIRAFYVGPARFFLSDHPIIGTRSLIDLPFSERVAYGLVCAARTVPVLYVLDFLRRLFGLYGRGVVFGRMNTFLIKSIGVALVAEAAIPLITHWVLMWLGLELHPSWRPPLSNLQPLVLGVVVWVIALVMQAASRRWCSRSA